jgi:hypothetical protein
MIALHHQNERVMKLNFSFTAVYIIYLSVAIFLHPVRDISTSLTTNTCNQTHIELKEVSVAADANTEVLHSELLFNGSF